MEQKDEEHLKLLRDQYGSNIKMATQEMLEFWLNRQPQASWNQLIEALKQEHIGLQYKAQEIEKMLQPEGIFIATYNNCIFGKVISTLSTVVLNSRDQQEKLWLPKYVPIKLPCNNRHFKI